MKAWQKFWLILLATLCLFHTLRDVLQLVGSDHWIATFWTKPVAERPRGFIWSPWNTVVLEVLGILVLLKIWHQKYFGWLGWASLAAVVCVFLSFGVYWLLASS